MMYAGFPSFFDLERDVGHVPNAWLLSTSLLERLGDPCVCFDCLNDLQGSLDGVTDLKGVRQ